MNILAIYAALVAVMSIITYFTYYADKQKAQNGKWRIRESVLLGLGFFGGALGALLAMNVYRHKTKHWYFWLLNTLSLLIHCAGAILIIVYCV